MQKLANDIVKSHFDDISSEKEPLCLIINGVAGTGKTKVILKLMLLEIFCQLNVLLLLPLTGKAAYSGCNCAFSIKVTYRVKGFNKDLTGQSLCRLQESVNDIAYIIIDE